MLLCIGCAGRDWPAAPQQDERLTLTTQRKEYLLGEPVIFKLIFRNTSKEIVKVAELVVTPGEYETPLRIAEEGSAFREFSPNLGTVCLIGRRAFPLGWGETLNYDYRVLGKPSREFQFAFPRAGNYRVYLEFPLSIAEGGGAGTITSNVLEVRVNQPAGDDLKTWQDLNNREFLALLQLEAVDKERKDVPMKLAKLLRSHPTSGYAPAMRHVLARIYFRHRLDLATEDQERLAQTLDISNVETLADDRLETRRAELLEKEIPLDKVLASLTKLGVPLDAAPDLKTKKVTLIDSYFTLRLSMRSLSDDLEASWERRGNGYYLVPFDPTKDRGFKPKGDR